MKSRNRTGWSRAISWAVFMGLVSAGATLATTDKTMAQEKSMSQVNITDELDDRLVIQPGTIWTIELDRSFADLAIGNVGVLDAFPLTDTSFYIQTKQVGITNVAIFSSDSEFISDIEIQVAIDNPEPKLEALINEAVPGAQVRVSMINNRVYLNGSVKKKRDIDVIIKIAESFRSTKEPVIYSFTYPEGQPVMVSVIRQGGATQYQMPGKGTEPQGIVTAYGTTALQSEEVKTEAPGQQPIVINVNGAEAAAENN